VNVSLVFPDGSRDVGTDFFINTEMVDFEFFCNHTGTPFPDYFRGEYVSLSNMTSFSNSVISGSDFAVVGGGVSDPVDLPKHIRFVIRGIMRRLWTHWSGLFN
jgi:hypothetical protein